ncbi:MAG: hypothetical protein U1C74_29775 [Phenylobacterium sp.]|nr:hypothetical protein [Phenylobacterium sp.]
MTFDLLAILGDAVWIFVMATIASATRRAVKAIPQDARLPMQWGLDRKPTWRAPRNLALGFSVGLPLVIGLVLSAAARATDLDAGEPLLLFLVRMAIAPVFALVHMLWLRGVMRTLEAEGALKP